MNIIFIGTSEFSRIVLEILIGAGHSPLLVITAPDRPAGRNQKLTTPPVKITANERHIEFEQPEHIEEIEEKIKNSNPDLIVVASYGQIIPRNILDIPQYGSLNVHPSLLPKYRGSSPIQNAILNGDKETGVTIMLMDEQIDHGPFIANVKYAVAPKITYLELENNLANLGGELLVNTIPLWIADSMGAVEQDHDKASFTKILNKEDGRIFWGKDAGSIERQIRAFHPWPGSFTFWKKDDRNTIRVKVIKADILSQEEAMPYKRGEVFVAKNGKVCVQCATDALILDIVHPEGREEMAIDEFLRGNTSFVSSILE